MRTKRSGPHIREIILGSIKPKDEVSALDLCKALRESGYELSTQQVPKFIRAEMRTEIEIENINGCNVYRRR